MGVFYCCKKRLQYLDGYNLNLSDMNNGLAVSPFTLDEAGNRAYRQWRDWKLAVYPQRVDELIVEIADPFSLTHAEINAFQSCFQRANMAIYTIKYNTDFADKKIVEMLGRQLGLVRLDKNLGADNDSITALQVMEGGRQQGYIPYSNLRLSWHTDGYYNLPQQQIRGIILHCVSPAANGGENTLVDHEMLYIHLRDQDPAYISALMQPQVMTIPANVENGVEIRAAQTGPVFSIDASGALHMRYSARKRNIIWSDDRVTQKAVQAMEEFLQSDSPWIFRHTLQSGQGLIGNNILHNRSGFENEVSGLQRLIYRGRYYDRLAATTFNDIQAKMS